MAVGQGQGKLAKSLYISLCGRVAIQWDGADPVDAVLGRRARLALAYLVTERSRPVPAAELADAVWGIDLPPTWQAAIRGVIARVRGGLAAAGLDARTALTSGPCGYQLHLPPGSSVDIEQAQRALHSAIAALGADPVRARSEARGAIGLLSGSFAGGGEGNWIERRQAECAELRLRSLEVLSQASSACGDVVTALWAAEEAVSLEPLRESAHVRVMAAHEDAGNRGAALRAYERCRRLLADELGASPSPETESAYLRLLGDEGNEATDTTGKPAPSMDDARSAPATHRVGNLPSPLTTFVGRDGEQERIRHVLESVRLITLTGPGGVGKSRLALEVASSISHAYPSGVWLVELAGLATGPLLAEHVLSALGLPEFPRAPAIESLVGHLAAARCLLVFDNCEHMVGPCAALVERLLKCGPDVAVLATSREPLGVDGETVWAVNPLCDRDAAALFVDRAAAAAPSVDLARSRGAVATICRRLDGLPLAIELAAARMRAMTVDDIAARLDDRFRLLSAGPRTSPARHQTLRAALDWSYESLSDLECSLFQRLSVFAGDLPVDGAAALWDEDSYVTLDTLARLVDKSLVVAERGEGQTRYRLLETTRQYAFEGLVQSGTEHDARRSQLRWAAELADAAETGLEGADQLFWLHRLDAELDNLRGVLDWAVTHHEGPSGASVSASLWRYWEIRGLLTEGRSRLNAALRADVSEPLRAKLLNAAAVLAQGQCDPCAARALYAEALIVFRSLADLRGMATSMNGLGNVAAAEGDLDAARSIFEENLATSRALGDPRLIAASLMNLGVVVHLLFDDGRLDSSEGAERACALYLESLMYYRALGDDRAVAQALENVAFVLPYPRDNGDDSAARALLEESLALRRKLDDRGGIATSTRILGQLALERHEYGAARSLHEESLAIEQDLGRDSEIVADLSSLAEIAMGEGNHIEAERLVSRALELLGDLPLTEHTVTQRQMLERIRSAGPAFDGIGR